MFQQLQRYFSYPEFDDLEKTQQARVSVSMIRFTIIIMPLLGVLSWFMAGAVAKILVSVLLGLELLYLGMLVLVYDGHLLVAQYVLATVLSICFLSLAYFVGGGVSSPAYTIYYLVIIITTVFLNNWATWIITSLGLLGGLIMAYAEVHAFLPPAIATDTPYWRWVVQSAGLIATAYATQLAMRGLHKTIQRLKETEARQTLATAKSINTAEELHQQNTLLNALHETTISLMNRLALPDLLEAMVKRAAELCQTQHGYVHLLETDGQLELKVGTGVFHDYIGLRLTRDQGLSGKVWQQGQTLLVKDYMVWPERIVHPSEQQPFHALIGVPLYVGSQVVGVFGLGHVEPERTFTDMEVELLNQFGVLASIALDNAQLYTAAQQELTERKRAEADLAAERTLLAQRVEERTAELRAANKALAQAGRLKDEFMAAVSHELRTPLSAVINLSEMMQEGIYGALNVRQVSALQTIQESGQHLLDLINDILDVSKVEAGQMQMQIQPVHVETVCQSSMFFVRQAALLKEIELKSNLDSQVSVIEADALRLKQILVNLLNNAVKFTPIGGVVGLDVTGDATAGQVHFAIWDTGIGIAPADLPKLFQPFVQLDSSLARQYNGTGLGLALVQRLVNLHGGQVHVESQVNGGSRFIVSLPWQCENNL